ncbi:DinB family protein [compost metagenome]
MNELIMDWYDYNIWANERIIDHLKTLPGEIFGKEVDLGFKSIAEVLGHIASADEVWFARIKEDSLSFIKAVQFTDLEKASSYFNNLHSQIHEYLFSIEKPQQIVKYKNTLGKEFQNSISEIIQQMVNHGTYHRGNISTILRHLGYTGILTDYIVYLRMRGA